MSQITRRTVLRLSAITIGGVAINKLAAGQELPPPPANPIPSQALIGTEVLPISQMSEPGKTFMTQLLRELVYNHFYVEPQISGFAAGIASIIIPRVLGSKKYTPTIANALQIRKEDVAVMLEKPKTFYTQEQWSALAKQLPASEAEHVYRLASKTQFNPAAMALARGEKANEIAEERRRLVTRLRPGQPYDMQQALGLYFDPQGPYGLGGMEGDQTNAHRLLEAIRNDGKLDKKRTQEMVDSLPPRYLRAVQAELRDFALLREQLHTAIKAEKLKIVHACMETRFAQLATMPENRESLMIKPGSPKELNAGTKQLQALKNKER